MSTELLKKFYKDSSWEAVASRAKELVLEGKESEIADILSSNKHLLFEIQARKVLTYLRESY